MKLFSMFKNKTNYPFYIKNREDIIHVHITKTAGTSLVHSMNFNRSNKSRGTKKHYFSKEIIDIVGQEHWDDAYKFTFVRNPWDRLFSLYRFKLRKGKIPSEKQGNTFGLWLKKSISLLDKNPYQKLKPQTQWLKNYDNKIELNFIGRFENLEKDVQKLEKELNMKIMVHCKVSGSRIYYCYILYKKFNLSHEKRSECFELQKRVLSCFTS